MNTIYNKVLKFRNKLNILLQSKTAAFFLNFLTDAILKIECYWCSSFNKCKRLK